MYMQKKKKKYIVTYKQANKQNVPDPPFNHPGTWAKKQRKSNK